MGTGKTTVAQLLARELDCGFREMDDEIEHDEQKKIKDIFADKGEDYFRQKEKNILVRLSSQKSLIVSCGGGVVIDPENRKLLRDTGVVICLVASPKVIYDRTKDCGDRPLLNVDDPLNKIKELLTSRDAYYREACHFFIDTDTLTPGEVVSRIKESLSE